MKTKKYLIGGLAAMAMIASVTFTAAAQEKKKTEAGKVIQKTGKAVEKGAKSVGNKTAEVAVKGTAKVADQTYKGKMAPDGSNVYIDGRNNKYYVNIKGAKVYLKPSEIRDRPAN
jgi:type II secretory pathway pseudopilin PulG